MPEACAHPCNQRNQSFPGTAGTLACGDHHHDLLVRVLTSLLTAVCLNLDSCSLLVFSFIQSFNSSLSLSLTVNRSRLTSWMHPSACLDLGSAAKVLIRPYREVADDEVANSQASFDLGNLFALSLIHISEP